MPCDFVCQFTDSVIADSRKQTADSRKPACLNHLVSVNIKLGTHRKGPNGKGANKKIGWGEMGINEKG
jgi:hypothetical protein